MPAPQDNQPPKKPPAYLPRDRCIRLWHTYHVRLFGECPTLKWLAFKTSIPLPTVYAHCKAQGLPLSRAHRPRKIP